MQTTKESAGMTEQITCDRCKHSVEVVSDDELCFACETFQAFVMELEERANMSNKDALEFARELQGWVLTSIVLRLQLPGNSLLKDLLETRDHRTEVAAQVFSATEEGAGMTEQIICDCWKQSVEVVSDHATLLRVRDFPDIRQGSQRSDYHEQQGRSRLRPELQELVLSSIVQRLELPGNSLLKDLLETLKPRGKPN